MCTCMCMCMCGVCVDMVVHMLCVLWCVRCVVVLCVLLVMCGVVWCGVVYVWCVWCGTLKTPPCVRSRRLRVYVQHMRAFSEYTRRRFESTHGGVSVSFLLSHLSVCPFSSPLFSSLFFLSSLLSVTMTMITRPVGSLCVHTALACECVRVRGLRSIPCLANMFVSCKKQLSWHNCARLVPRGMKWAGICAGNG